MNSPFMRCVRWANLPRTACSVLIGKHHTLTHRLVAGLIIMVAGVAIAKGLPALLQSGWAHFLSDLLGYGVHGMGLTPFIEAATESNE